MQRTRSLAPGRDQPSVAAYPDAGEPAKPVVSVCTMPRERIPPFALGYRHPRSARTRYDAREKLVSSSAAGRFRPLPIQELPQCSFLLHPGTRARLFPSQETDPQISSEDTPGRCATRIHQRASIVKRKSRQDAPLRMVAVETLGQACVRPAPLLRRAIGRAAMGQSLRPSDSTLGRSPRGRR